MCGIVGANFGGSDEIKRMTDILSHRGPDSEDIFVDQKVSLGHRRLSILDLSDDGCQPMEYENSVIIFNGEVYNFQEIKSRLEQEGYCFDSETDTEVVLAAYEAWGRDCVKEFNGMWSFAIYDREKGIIFCSRDRFGIKPFYFYFEEGHFVFASEIKSLIKSGLKLEIDEESISEYLMFRSPVGSETMYENVEELYPGHNLIFDLESKSLEKERYWDLEADNFPSSDSEQKIEDVAQTLEDSVEKRMISDVTVGSMLSGGLDSSLIASIMSDCADIDTFTVRFGNEFDEGDFARKVSDHAETDHHELFLDFDDFIRAMEEYASLKDQPVGVPNEVALFRLASDIRENENKVVLAGEGADEVFYGYSRIFRSVEDFKAMNSCGSEAAFKQKFPEIYREYDRCFDSMLDLFLQRYSYWPEDELEKHISSRYFNQDYRKKFEYHWKANHDYEHKISYLFLKLHVPVLLSRFDSSMMGHGIEGRVPFLDHRLVSKVFSLPNEDKIRWKSPEDYKKSVEKPASGTAGIHDIPKYVLKEGARGRLPDEIIGRKKQGFPIPFLEWRGEMLEYGEELFDEESFVKQIFEDEYLERLKNLVRETDDNYEAQRYWMLISLELWHRNWVS